MVHKRRITVDLNIMAGKPVIAGTRIPVDLILAKLTQNPDVKTLLAEYPRLTREDIQAALGYARDLVQDEDIYPTA